MASLELELDEKIFDHENERKKLQEQMAQLSPRREATSGRFEVMTLPFYDEISPSTALEKLFNWFYTPNVGTPSPEAGTSADAEGEEEKVDDVVMQSNDPAEKEKHQVITMDEFNCLRRCIGEDEVSLEEWKRALEELGKVKGKLVVRRTDFKALFGPPPFFGSEDVQGIVKYVMSAEERIHFAQVVLDRFGNPSRGNDKTVTGKTIGLPELQSIQAACFVDPYSESEWNELLNKLSLTESQPHLDWKKFTETFGMSVKGKKVYGPHNDPASVVYAVLANDKVQTALEKSNKGTAVSRTTITDLLRLQQNTVPDDKKWMQLLKDMQTKYRYQTDQPANSDDETDNRSKIPLVVVRNTRNQVLSYEVTFDEHEAVGLTLQSDFYGHCLTVASTESQAARHPIIQTGDIVAMVDQASLMYDNPAADKAEEEKRIARGMRLLEDQRSRKTITFQRQESYFQYDHEQRSLRLFIKTVEDIPGGGKIQIKLPAEIPWSPIDYSGNDDTCLGVVFHQPDNDDPDYASVRWIPGSKSSKTVEVTLDEIYSIPMSTSVVMEITNLSGADVRVVGPCEFGDTSSATQCINLVSGWGNREVGFRSNPIRKRIPHQGDDQSLEPIECNFEPGDSGIELTGDFFGQCAVVKKVEKPSQAADNGVQEFDILTSITYVKEDNSLERIHCIKSLAPSKDNDTPHVKDISKLLRKRHKSGGRYRLQFLRLNSHFYHDPERTVVTLRALTTLTTDSVVILRMPNAKWHVNGPLLEASIVDPEEVKIKEIFWDSQQQALRVHFGECSIALLSQIVINVEGLSSGDEAKKLCAGPGEVTVLGVDDGMSVPGMEVQFHDNWDVIAQETLDVSKVARTLKEFDTSPAKLWQVLEYTSLLFDMYKSSPTAEHIDMSGLNRFVGIVCGDSKKIKDPEWKKLCRAHGADSLVGLNCRQFACSWSDIVGYSNHKAKDTYVRLHTAERLFKKLISIYEEDEDGNPKYMSTATINRLVNFLKFSADKKKKALKDLDSKELPGWNCDAFSQIVCGKHPIVTIEENDAMALWMKLYYSEKLFDAYNTKKMMRKKNMGDLLSAARIKTPKFTSDLWTAICESVDVDENVGLSLGDFIEVYAGDLLGPRHAVADWYRIETFKLLPERRAREDSSKEAVMSVAPEKVNVKDIAAKALEQTASTEEIFQDLVDKGLEFSKMEDIKEKVSDTFQFESELCAKRKSRATGFLSIGLKSITELADHIIQRDASFDAPGVAQELYVMFQITDAEGLKPRFRPQKARGRFVRTMEALFGRKDSANVYEVRKDEMWDQGFTQGLMRDMKKAEKALKALASKPRSPEYAEAVAKLKDLERQLIPPPPSPPLSGGVPDWRVFSSLILRDRSPDAIIRFPDDQFRLFVPPRQNGQQLYVVCKLFKRIGSDVSRLKLKLDEAKQAYTKANDAHEILEDLVRRQQDHLRHIIAEQHMQNVDAFKAVRSEVWTSVAKLKQLRQDLADFEDEVNERAAKVRELSESLESALMQQEEEQQAFRGEVGAVTVGELGQAISAGTSEAHVGKRRTSMKRQSFTALPPDKVKEPQPRLDAKKVKFIGQAFFDLDELLDVLHGDKEHTEDLAELRTETHNDVGVVLLSFKYKCASLQEQSVATKLSDMHIKMAPDDILEKEINEMAFEYPSSSHLEVNWKSDELKHGDRMCLIREGTQYKVSTPYFFLVWSALDQRGEPFPFGIPHEDLASRTDVTFTWWLPKVLEKVYSASRDPNVTTDPTLRSGNLHFPSSVDLSLPPGIYKLYLVRNETDKYKNRSRIVLGTSESLAVLPGVNGVHTSFGTTPLVDVKPMSASLQVFMESNREAVAASLINVDGFRDEDYFRRIAVEQELVVVRNDLKFIEELLDQPKKKDRGLLEKKKDELEEVIKTLEAMKDQLVPGSSTKRLGNDGSMVSSSSSSAITSSGKAVFAFTFHGDEPTPGDKIIILPADVVRVSDLLRATILGRLQANDPRQVARARAAMEKELVEVEEFFSARMSFKTLKKVILRYLKPIMDTMTTNSGAAQKSAAYNSATGAMDDTFVWDECMEQFKSCSSETKKCFPYIIRDLLDEIGARKKLLGLTVISDSTAKSKLGQVTSLLKCGIELSVPPLATTLKQDSSGRKMAVGEVSTVLGSRFRQGGFFVAKYVRRADANTSTATITTSLEVSAGELCRYGPFYVERAMIVYSPVQVAIMFGKFIYRVVMSDQGKLLLKAFGQAYLSLIKYFLAVVSLSFNINVLAGNFKFDVKGLQSIMKSFRDRLATYFGPLENVLMKIYDFFSGYIQELVDSLKELYVAGECLSGFFLFAVLGMIFSATFIVYVVVQEDLLRKVQKLHMYLPINPGKGVLSVLEQVGALLVIPLYLAIKSCVLFISQNWSEFYHLVHDDTSATLTNLTLYTTATPTCPNVSLAKVNHGFGIAALVLIIFFLFVCLPLLLLDLFSWVPISELEKPERLKTLAQSRDRLDIKAAVHSNANLVEFHPIRALKFGTASCVSKLGACCNCCKGNGSSCCATKSKCCMREGPRNPLFTGFARHYDDYVNMAFRELMKKYGIIGLFLMFVNVYAHLMLQSIGRALGIFLGWRLRADHMYPNPLMKSKSTYKVFDIFCLRFNIAWKVQYIKDKMVMPFVNICLVTLGLWGEQQWTEFNVQERANDCYRMEPSGEIKQLQMMSLHGKIISLFWLCIPETMVLAYLAEVLNRGPVFSYFLNRQFLQADIPDSEREKDPVWRFHWLLAFRGEDDVVYLSDTRFYSTLLKWGSSVVEIFSLLMVYASKEESRTILLGITLISAVVTPVLEFNQQMIQAYMDYVETAENLAKSAGIVKKLEKAKKVADKVKEVADKVKEVREQMPDVEVNTNAVMMRLQKKKASAPPGRVDPTVPASGQSGGSAANGVATATQAPGALPLASATPGVQASARAEISSVAAGAPPAGAPPSFTSSAATTAATMAQLIGPAGGVLHVGAGGRHSEHSDAAADESDDDPTEDPGADEEDGEGDEENERGEGNNDIALAALVESTGLIKSTKELIQLNAMPQVSYVVLTDALDSGEGEITISWQVNAKQRFHALDAIGMFPARAKGDLTIRTMDDCICYRLLKHQDAEPFGWSPKNESEDAERELIMLQARSLRDLTVREVSKMKKTIQEVKSEHDTEEVVKARVEEHYNMLTEADKTMDKIMTDRHLRPYKKRLPDILEDDIIANKFHEKAPRISRAYSLGAASREEAAKRVRKVVSGQVKFRPANNCVKENDPTFETFIYGNDAGIYQSKYGLHGFEFCYLRCTEGENKVVGIDTGKDAVKGAAAAPKSQKVLPTGVAAPQAPAEKNYELIERYVSNPIQIGTFNIFMNLTCDRPLVGSQEKLNLSWTIYGVAYSILSNPKMRNCIGFYRVHGADGSGVGSSGSEEAKCARIEIVPPSAYLEASDSEPCSGRMTVTTPNDPGVYEIRFLFNFFKKAQLHRQCQVFGDLEDEMQHLRIRSFYEKRALTEELRKFSLREPNVWGIARMNTHAWLKSMLLSTIREPVETSVINSTSAYSDFLFVKLKKKFQSGLESPNRMFQRRIAQIMAPLRLNSFLDVLMVAFQSSSQMNDQLASITFISPTEEDEKKRGLNKERDQLLLPPDAKLRFLRGRFQVLAMNYLREPSLCGYHDFLDDILLTHGQLTQTLDQIVSNLSSTCVTLYESAIAAAVDETMKVADEMSLTNALRGLDVMLMDLCRNHIQSMIRALLQTDCQTGRKWLWHDLPKGPIKKMASLRSGGATQSAEDSSFELVVDHQPAAPVKETPVTAKEPQPVATPIIREYIALRRWIRPKLERKIATILKQRHARMMDGNLPIVFQFVACLRRPGLSLAGNPFPNHRAMKTESSLYFLQESRDKEGKKKSNEDEKDQAVADGAIDPVGLAEAMAASGEDKVPDDSIPNVQGANPNEGDVNELPQALEVTNPLDNPPVDVAGDGNNSDGGGNDGPGEFAGDF